jgi:hypothetical protein
VSVAASARDSSGAPLDGVECTFEIASQPGDDASLNPVTATTNEDGVATTNLQVGSIAGAITIEATCGDVSDTLSVNVVGESSSEPADPPASLPEAGSGPKQGAENTVYLVLAAALAAVVALSGVGYMVRATRR